MNEKKAIQLTNLIKKLADHGIERDSEIKTKISALESALNEISEANVDEINEQYIKFAYNKIKNLEQQLEKIELLKKAILAKAFRGELGTNNPDEESAENLLKEILAEK